MFITIILGRAKKVNKKTDVRLFFLDILIIFNYSEIIKPEIENETIGEENMELIFIRHGQASFGSWDYDVLSELGKEQSLLTAQYLLETDLSFDRAYSGTLERQVDTADLVLKQVQSRVAEPHLTQIPGLNEYQFEAILKHFIPIIGSEDSSLRQHVENLFTDKKAFQQLFDRAINKWLAGDSDPEGIEGWQHFRGRVEAAIEQITAENERGSRILIFSSGGVISTAVHLATGMSPYDAIRTGWGLVNTSITKFKFGGAGLILHTFNSYPHLEGRNAGEFITYR